MKNAMKKLMAFALVAVMLVAAVPFQAFAASTDITVVVVDGSDNDKEYRYTWSPSDPEKGCQVSALLQVLHSYDTSALTFSNAYYYPAQGSTATKGPVDADDYIPGGDSVRIRLEPIDNGGDDDKNDGTENKEPEKQEPVVEYITMRVNLNSADNTVYQEQVFPANGESATVSNLLKHYYAKYYDADWQNSYDFSHAWSSKGQKNIGYNDEVKIGDTVSIRLNAQEIPTAPETEDTNTGTNTGTNSGNTNSSYNKFPYNVYLNIYNDTKLGSAEKVIKINDTAAKDGKVTLGEVKNIVKQYYNAVDSDTGIIYDGLYLAMGNWSNDYIWDVKDSEIDDVDEMRNQSTVYINVMIDNAKLASSSTADSSNPKTGDNIFMAVSVMTMSAAALAVFFYLNKKRAM